MIKTKREMVKQEVGLWAVPKDGNGLVPGEFPFTYELYGTTTHWKSNAVFVTLVSVMAYVPDGLDLLSMMHQTLDQRESKAQSDYNAMMASIAQERKKLYLLAAPMQQEQGVDLGDGHELMPAEDPLYDALIAKGLEPQEASSWADEIRVRVADGEDEATILAEEFA